MPRTLETETDESLAFIHHANEKYRKSLKEDSARLALNIFETRNDASKSEYDKINKLITRSWNKYLKINSELDRRMMLEIRVLGKNAVHILEQYPE